MLQVVGVGLTWKNWLRLIKNSSTQRLVFPVSLVSTYVLAYHCLMFVFVHACFLYVYFDPFVVLSYTIWYQSPIGLDSLVRMTWVVFGFQVRATLT
jgi:hypothetical protein